MKERQILFKGEMVRAILDGQKTQTRRVVTRRNSITNYIWDSIDLEKSIIDPGMGGGQYLKAPLITNGINEDEIFDRIRCRYSIGDLLYVRETWRTGSGLDDLPARLSGTKSPYQYKADMKTVRGNDVSQYSQWGKWRPSIHMPKWAARIWMEITGVRVERLQDITGPDAIAEGVNIPSHIPQDGADHAWAIREFSSLWNSTTKDPSYKWDANHWVWVIEFKRINKN